MKNISSSQTPANISLRAPLNPAETRPNPKILDHSSEVRKNRHKDVFGSGSSKNLSLGEDIGFKLRKLVKRGDTVGIRRALQQPKTAMLVISNFKSEREWDEVFSDLGLIEAHKLKEFAQNQLLRGIHLEGFFKQNERHFEEMRGYWNTWKEPSMVASLWQAMSVLPADGQKVLLNSLALGGGSKTFENEDELKNWVECCVDEAAFAMERLSFYQRIPQLRMVLFEMLGPRSALPWGLMKLKASEGFEKLQKQNLAGYWLASAAKDHHFSGEGSVARDILSGFMSYGSIVNAGYQYLEYTQNVSFASWMHRLNLAPGKGISTAKNERKSKTVAGILSSWGIASISKGLLKQFPKAKVQAFESLFGSAESSLSAVLALISQAEHKNLLLRVSSSDTDAIEPSSLVFYLHFAALRWRQNPSLKQKFFDLCKSVGQEERFDEALIYLALHPELKTELEQMRALRKYISSSK